MLTEAASLIFIAMLWGGTNPLIKINSKEIVKIRGNSKVLQFILEFKYLVTNIKYLLPMTINQIGSLLYFVTLKNIDLTLSVPVTNSLTFAFTAFSSWILGEQFPRKNTIYGIILITIGSTLCCLDKFIQERS